MATYYRMKVINLLVIDSTNDKVVTILLTFTGVGVVVRSVTRVKVGLKITFKFFTEVLFLSIILCLANTGIVNVLV